MDQKLKPITSLHKKCHLQLLIFTEDYTKPTLDKFINSCPPASLCHSACPPMSPAYKPSPHPLLQTSSSSAPRLSALPQAPLNSKASHKRLSINHHLLSSSDRMESVHSYNKSQPLLVPRIPSPGNFSETSLLGLAPRGTASSTLPTYLAHSPSPYRKFQYFFCLKKKVFIWNETGSSVEIQTDQEMVIQSEVRRKANMLMHICGIQKKGTDESIRRSGIEMQTQRMNVRTQQGEWDGVG